MPERRPYPEDSGGLGRLEPQVVASWPVFSSLCWSCSSALMLPQRVCRVSLVCWPPILQICHVWGSGRGERRLFFAAGPAARSVCRLDLCEAAAFSHGALAPALATLTLRLSVAVHSAPPGCRVQPGEDSPAAAAAWSRRSRQGQRVRGNAWQRQRDNRNSSCCHVIGGGK